MEYWINKCLKRPELVTLITNNSLNPEPVYYYQNFSWSHLFPELDRPKTEIVTEKDTETVNKIVAEFTPQTGAGAEMWELLKKEMSIEKVIAVEVDHCVQAYACLLVSSEHGNIFYSGDTRTCQNLNNYA